MIKEIESTGVFREFVAGPSSELKFTVLKVKGMVFPIIYGSSLSANLPPLLDIFLELFHLADLSIAHILIPTDDVLQTRLRDLPSRHLAITRPDDVENENYHFFEITKDDLELLKNGLDRSSAKSYGIHSQDFLAQEVTRLKSQNVIGGRYIENLLDELKVGNRKKVVDLGCGVGSLIAPFAAKYPDIDFIGIDSEPVFIYEACKHQVPNLSFYVADIFNAINDHRDADLFILRFVVQHLGQDGFEELLSEFKGKARTGARLLIYDSDDRLFTLEPDLKEATFLLEAAAFAQAKHGGNRSLALGVLSLTTKYGLTKEYFDIDYWDTTKIPFATLLALLKPLFQDKPDPSYLDEKRKSLFFSKLQVLPEPYMRGGMVVCCVRK